MNLQLNRQEFLKDRTIGSLYVNSKWFCYTLEDLDRHLETGGTKAPGMTAIPRGKYKIVMYPSKHFGAMMPCLLDVPQFTGIMIHPGNTPKDTEGCILLGKGRDVISNNLVESKLAFNAFLDILTNAFLRKEEVWIEVE